MTQAAKPAVFFFWHPIAKKKICRGIGKFSDVDLTVLRDDLKKLKILKPKVAGQAPPGIGRLAFEFYFQPIYGGEWSTRYNEYLTENMPPLVLGEKRDWTPAELESASHRYGKIWASIEMEQAKKRIAELERSVAELREQIGARPATGSVADVLRSLDEIKDKLQVQAYAEASDQKLKLIEMKQRPLSPQRPPLAKISEPKLVRQKNRSLKKAPR